MVRIYEQIEQTTKRLDIQNHLVELYKIVDKELVDIVTYLTLGQLYPDFKGIELGLADALVTKAISKATGFSEDEIKVVYKEEGDLGLACETLMKKKKQMTLFSEPLTVERVYKNFTDIALAQGSGAQDLKIKLLTKLIHDATPVEAKYIVRMVLGKLRLGVAEMTILDALAELFSSNSDEKKMLRTKIENGYNVCSDIGLVVKTLFTSGISALDEMKVQVGIPIRAMLAERVSSLDEIFERMGTNVAFEYKYDGLRVQAHINNDKIQLFSRRLENITSQFPDLVDMLKDAIHAKSCIVEGENVPIDPNTGELLPFQEISHRRGRKYDVYEAMEEYPVTLFLFDCLFVEGVELLNKDYLTRRKYLQKIVMETDRIKISDYKLITNKEEGELYFNEALASGSEGIMAKSTAPGSIYRAGARGFLWIKYKREYKSELTDTLDLVVIGGFIGRGRRTGSYGALLMGAYNKDMDTFESVCKLGSGFDDPFLESLNYILNPIKSEKKPQRVNSKMKPDVWFEPKYVFEVRGAELTLSPIHTASWNKLKSSAGIAVRFPTFTGNIKHDRKPEDATTTDELEKLYKQQLKKIT